MTLSFHKHYISFHKQYMDVHGHYMDAPSMLHWSVAKNSSACRAFRQRNIHPTRYLLLVAKQQKAKSGQTRNDARANGKANKTKPGQRRTRALEKPSPVELVLMGKGLYTSWAKKAATDKPRGIPRRVKDSDD